MRKGHLNPKYIRVMVRIDLTIREVIRTGQIVGTGDSTQIVGPDRTIELAILEETLVGMADKNDRGGYRNDRHNDYNRGRCRLRERTFTRNYSSGRDRSSSNSRSRSGSRTSKNRDRIRCYKCREYDHFERDCPYSRGKERSRTTTTNAEHGRANS